MSHSSDPDAGVFSSAGRDPWNTEPVTPFAVMPRLSLMMFLQFFTWGLWFSTLGKALTNNQLGDFIGRAYSCGPLAAIIAPLFLGLIADRLFSSQRVMGVLMLIGSGIMYFVPEVAERGAEGGDLFAWLVMAYMLCYMPTLGLSNTIAFTHIPSQDRFPIIRVWGTIGWIAAGLLVGGTGWDGTFTIFRLAAGSSLVLAVYCLTLPNTPPPLKDQPLDIRSLLMVDAFKLLGRWNFLCFAVCSTAICVPLAYYHGSASQFLDQTGFQATGATLTLGQMSEIVFMILIPFFFRRLGVKVMLLVGMAAWVGRFLLFSYGAPQQVTWMLLLGVVLHGICYDFFFVTGFMYTDKKSPPEIRGQAQSLLVFLTQGVGMWLGFRLMGNGVKTAESDALAASLKSAAGEPGSFFSAFGKMLTRELPAGIDQPVLDATMEQWKVFWQFPALLAAVVFVLFALMFWDRIQVVAADGQEH